MGCIVVIQEHFKSEISELFFCTISTRNKDFSKTSHLLLQMALRSVYFYVLNNKSHLLIRCTLQEAKESLGAHEYKGNQIYFADKVETTNLGQWNEDVLAKFREKFDGTKQGVTGTRIEDITLKEACVEYWKELKKNRPYSFN
jgi:hypothetical protein